MKLDLVDQSNIDGCVHLKSNKIIIVCYLKFIFLMLINHDLVMQTCRFMGDSKRSLKNNAPIHLEYKARLGGPIQYRMDVSI